MAHRYTYPRREEIATQGFDPFRQLDPDAFGAAGSTGLYVPAFPTTYTFLLAVADLDAGDSIIGLRQYLDLLALIGTTDGELTVAPYYPLLQPITEQNPRFRLVDGGDTWILTREPKANAARPRGPVDQDSFRQRDSESAALVYETAAFGGPPFPPGYGSLTAYTPPAIRGTKVLAVRDRRWPWVKQSNQRLDFVSDKPERWRFYCVLTQSDPATRNNPTIPSGSGGYVLTPEQGFVQSFPALARYGWVAGDMIIRRERGPRRRRPKECEDT